MGLVVRQSFKSTLVTYVGVALGALNLLYFFPRYLNPELIGIRELLLGGRSEPFHLHPTGPPKRHVPVFSLFPG